MSGIRPSVWFVLAVYLLGMAGPVAAQSTLTEKQIRFLENAGHNHMVGRWNDLDTNQLVALRKKVDAYAADIPKYHQVGGLILSARFADTNRTRVVRYEELQDSGAWTGFYLAGLAYWFAVDRRGETLERIRTTLDGVDRLIQASARPGYIPAFVGRADDPAYRDFYAIHGGADPKRPGFGKLAFAGDGANRDLVWLGGASRDNTAGLVMGLAMVHKFVRENRIRSRVSNVVETLIGRLEADRWRISDGHGHETFVTPLLGAAILRLGASVNTNRHFREYEARAAEVVDLPPPVAPRYADLRPSVFSAASLLTLNALENSKKRGLGYQDKVTRLWRDSGNQLNPWLAVAFVNAFDHAPSETLALATLQGVLSSFPQPPRWAGPGDLSGTNGLDLVSANGMVWSKHALPLASQGVQAFQWTRASSSLAPVPAELVAHPGLDLFTIYWMARDAGIIRDEADPITPTQSGLRRPQDARRTNATLALPPSSPIVGKTNIVIPRK